MWSTAYLLNLPQDAVMRNLSGTKFMRKGKLTQYDIVHKENTLRIIIGSTCNLACLSRCSK